MCFCFVLRNFVFLLCLRMQKVCLIDFLYQIFHVLLHVEFNDE